ncbi:hypothetical protein EW145_g593 [Phellinidium pouzarii]|uniref:F-box domain-containing protein n=1 Tax=Phellinidium pouzarii TaxID=167371 RepID=A0A4S4LNB4_9AGAM|nr:hypothetical protein EW145_g593 [Phellinidium pouzarii]
MALDNLPLDILDALCQFVHNNDLLALSRSSSAFCPPAQRYIYRRLALFNFTDAVRCLRTLRKRRHLARHVRVLTLRLDPNALVLRSFVDLLAAVLSEMPNLTSLDIVIPPSASRAFFAAEMRGTVYKRLSHFSCNLPLDDVMSSFLQRLPAATELQLGERAASLSSSPSLPILPSSALPNLALFMGPSDAAAVLVPGRPLESVHLYSGELSEDVLVALARSSSAITVFGAFTHSLSPSVLHCLAENLPHLHHLRIMTMYHASNQPDDLFYGQVVQILSTLPALVSAELAGFRWVSWKDTTGSRSEGRPKSKPARTHAAARTEPLDASRSINIGLY